MLFFLKSFLPPALLSPQNKKGQAFIEYILILSVIVAVAGTLLLKFSCGDRDSQGNCKQGIGKWGQSIMGGDGYIACLLQTGRLPGQTQGTSACSIHDINPNLSISFNSSDKNYGEGNYKVSGSGGDYKNYGGGGEYKISGSGGDYKNYGGGGEYKISGSGGDYKNYGGGGEYKISGSGGDYKNYGGGGEYKISGSGNYKVSGSGGDYKTSSNNWKNKDPNNSSYLQDQTKKKGENSSFKKGKSSQKTRFSSSEAENNPSGKVISLNASNDFMEENNADLKKQRKYRRRRGRRGKKRMGLRDSGSVSSNPGYSGKRHPAIMSAGYIRSEREEQKERERLIAVAGNISSVKKSSAEGKEKRSELIRKKRKKDKKVDTRMNKWSFGNIFRIILIICVIVAIVLLIGSQSYSVKKAMK